MRKIVGSPYTTARQMRRELATIVKSEDSSFDETMFDGTGSNDTSRLCIPKSQLNPIEEEIRRTRVEKKFSNKLSSHLNYRRDSDTNRQSTDRLRGTKLTDSQKLLQIAVEKVGSR